MYTYVLHMHVHTVYVFDHVDTEAMPRDGGEHLPRAPPPGQVVGGAPGGDGTEQQLEVVLLGQLLRRRHKGAELHQDLQERKGEEIDSGRWQQPENDLIKRLLGKKKTACKVRPRVSL